MTDSRPLLTPFDAVTTAHKVRLAEDARNSRDPQKASLACTPNSRWRSRAEVINGREAIVQFLQRKRTRVRDYRLIKELWAFTDNRNAVRLACQWLVGAGNWFRPHGNENRESDDNVLLRLRIASINDLPILESQRLSHWPLGYRPFRYSWSNK